MEATQTPLPIDTLIALLLAASVTAVAVKWIRMPYAVALVIAGLIIGISKIMPPVTMTPDLVLMIFLPALLFEASWNLDIKALKRDWLSISMLATVGVVVCMFSVAAILHYLGGMNIQTALLFGAMVSATDPVSVVALFRDMGIDKRLTMILEGESLFNDGTAVVLFKIVLAIVISGGQYSLPGSCASFVFVVCGGAAIGTLLGFIASRVTRAFDDHLLEITLTMVTAYGAFLLADRLHVSPVIAVVAAGIVLGNYGSHTGMSPSTRLAVNSFWEYAAFLVNSLLFLLIGLQVQWPLMVKYGELIGLGVLAVLVSRILVVYGLCPFFATKRLPIPAQWRILLAWGGLRGALVMAMALSLPLSFPDREAIINLTFGVVLFTLLVPGLTMEPLVRILGLVPQSEKLHRYEKYKALLLGYKAEMLKLETMHTSGEISPAIYNKLAQDLQGRVLTAEQELARLALTDHSIDKLHIKQARGKLMEFRKDFLNQQARQGALSEEDLHSLKAGIDSEMEELENAFSNADEPESGHSP
ncbi:MAG: Na+/H+ antiporter [Cyanobacteria bacterium SZAS LIN-2]|nr:Na+/H+ antiporter [Cyanobacteria bacterium SZAS LIN-3]MBS1994729.1 Na+/H+ antiporter [Cyanobacteria bacterium SZAS LIN-2]MBS2006935.1 Na+/H+ antiporter [Cyanobacteria bacterium SZAS TMP-1]